LKVDDPSSKPSTFPSLSSAAPFRIGSIQTLGKKIVSFLLKNINNIDGSSYGWAWITFNSIQNRPKNNAISNFSIKTCYVGYVRI